MDLPGHESEIPIPISSSFGGGGNGSHVTTHGHHHHHHHHPPIIPPDSPPTTLHHQLNTSNGPQSLSSPTSEDQQHHHHHHHNIVPYTPKRSTGLIVRYRECLKNHAASIGGNATDGCGEFMPSGEEGTIEALKCSACNCHRNFHRKEIEGENIVINRRLAANKGLLISGVSDVGYYNPPRPSPVLAAGPQLHHGHGHMVMPLGAVQASESDEMEGGMMRQNMVKKRFRTKFTPEQKEKMLGFAERVGWRLQRQEEGVVQQFCQEIGVKRRVLKVWMHNNKHNLAKNKSPPPQLQLE